LKTVFVYLKSFSHS